MRSETKLASLDSDKRGWPLLIFFCPFGLIVKVFKGSILWVWKPVSPHSERPLDVDGGVCFKMRVSAH